ncbi:alpha/beta hydrolase [Halobacillus litoralis]|uniref:Alpha/beta hydrolase n=1 Tax=Halobacillus litoralis TaxID=45668 RepID=A0A845DY02_9BACI|nr:alpha/beta hydrolase [Halobacillus litoralis]MYL48225.1 alpha/beta hydrolase [Halobacillus litoralis]
MEVHRKEVHGLAGKIAYTYIQNGSDRVCFMFAGRGYSYDRPLFYYSTMKLIEDAFDIVHVHYDYAPSFFDQPWKEIAKLIERDVSAVVGDVLHQKEYQHVCFLGKSMGTLPIAEGLIHDYQGARFVLLTPLFKHDLYKKPLTQTSAQVLVFVGGQGHHYIQDVVENLAGRSNMRIEVLEKANHSLDLADMDTSSSIEVMKQVVESIGTFMKE